MRWLEWAGWDGISGIVALIALIAALVFGGVELASWFRQRALESPRSIAAKISRSPGAMNGMRDVKVVIRTMGPAVMYELEVYFVHEDGVDELLQERSIFDVHSAPIEFEKTVNNEELSRYWVVVRWVEPGRRLPKQGGFRFRISNEGGFDSWRLYAWPRFPRKKRGRWRESPLVRDYNGYDAIDMRGASKRR